MEPGEHHPAVVAVAWLLGGVVVLPFAILATVLDGLTASLLWSWFVVPTMHLAPLTIMQAYGICLVGSAMIGTTKQWRPKPATEQERKEKRNVELVAPFLRPTLLVGIGWVVKHWV